MFINHNAIKPCFSTTKYTQREDSGFNRQNLNKKKETHQLAQQYYVIYLVSIVKLVL